MAHVRCGASTAAVVFVEARVEEGGAAAGEEEAEEAIGAEGW